MTPTCGQRCRNCARDLVAGLRARAVPWPSVGVAMATTLIASVVGLPVGAQATPPPNDDIDRATVVSTLPYSDSSSTEDVSREESDPDCGVGGTRWFSYTPTADAWVEARAVGDGVGWWREDDVLGVYTSAGGELTELYCVPGSDDDSESRAQLPVLAGTTYYFMLAACCGEPTSAVFLLKKIPSPVTEVTMTLTRATVSGDGELSVSGSITCDSSAEAEFAVWGSQRRRGRLAEGSTGDHLPCTTIEQDWSLSIPSLTETAFAPGRISVSYHVEVFNETKASGAYADGSQTLRARPAG